MDGVSAATQSAEFPSIDGISIRDHRPGDLGWIIHRQATLYCREFGFDGSFEALLCEIAARFLRAHVPTRERCWVAEANGVIVGSVSLVRVDDITAKLRMLYVERETRGTGLGHRLVATCIAFARAVGYARITLWTNDVLIAARSLYEKTGFRLTAAEPPTLAFGRVMASETWDLML